MKHLSIALLVFLLASCQAFDEEDSVRLVEDIPTFKAFVDSLSNEKIMVAKWARHNDSVIYSDPDTVNWKRELEVLRKSDVNHLRYRESYSVTDTTMGPLRTVRFDATSSDQEVRYTVIQLREGRVVKYEVEKVNNSLFSSSRIRFYFALDHYELELDQAIPFLFKTHQYVYGALYQGGELYHGEFHAAKVRMPVSVVYNDEAHQLFVVNGKERIGFNRFSQRGDTLVYGSDYFRSSFRLWDVTDSTLVGDWINEKRERVQIMKFTAKKGVPYRFYAPTWPEEDLTGAYTAVFFDHLGHPEDTVILEVEQRGPELRGSFRTETGDYRFLEGAVTRDSIFLSTMDGTHAYLFRAAVRQRHMDGEFHAGPTYMQTWSAMPKEAFDLRKPESITKAVAGVPFDFSFPDEKGVVHALSDDRYANKPVVISIMGTWCSNCLDEARFLIEAHEKFHEAGLEFVALDFELIGDSARAISNIERHKSGLQVPYPVLLASLSSNKQKAAELLPALSQVRSYPTLVVLDKNHEIVRIHTGFNGPATGEERYQAFRQEYFELFETLASH